MGDGEFDKGKGRIKQATGTLTGDKDLEREGKADRAQGSVKEGIDKVAETARDAVDRDKK